MTKNFYQHNRARLLEACGPESLIIICGGHEVQSTNDMTYSFLQDASFLWLTGVTLPGWKVVIDGKSKKEWLIAPTKSEGEIVFSGAADYKSISAQAGVTEVVYGEGVEALMGELSEKYSEVYTIRDDPYAQHINFLANPSERANNEWLAQYFTHTINCRAQLYTLRAIKQDDEIAVMQRAVDITVNAFTAAKRAIATVTSENELEAEFTYAFRKQQAMHAYEPIVAAGKNGVTLHYTDNNAPLPKNGLIVIDIGASFGGYAADITRTYAIGEPTERERAIHRAVEKAQKHIIELIRPGASIKEYQQQSDEIMKDALLEVGLLKDREDKESFWKYFPHAISHGLGGDVHESLGGFKEFKPGMVLTVEPGIYIPEEGIGVRIEDDILVTEDGYKNLSADLATEL